MVRLHANGGALDVLVVTQKAPRTVVGGQLAHTQQLGMKAVDVRGAAGSGAQLRLQHAPDLVQVGAGQFLKRWGASTTTQKQGRVGAFFMRTFSDEH